MKRTVRVVLLALLVAGCVRLFLWDEAAKPGPLRTFHAEAAECRDCHVPWKGVEEGNCLFCHPFPEVSGLRPSLRFHEERARCLKCHSEHRGPNKAISRMDHTLLNPDLACSQCHLDPHQGLFGENCRECHGISTWRIEGYRHPDREERNCDRCHRPPLSHRDPHFWERIETQHQIRTGLDEVPSKDCWRCHVVHDWRHLLM